MLSLAALSFPIGVVLVPLALFAVFYVVYGLSNLVLILKSGTPSAELSLSVILFALGTLAVFSVGFLALSRYDFTSAVSLSGLADLLSPKVSGF